MAGLWFLILALTLVVVLALLAASASVAVWRIRSLALIYRCSLIGVIAIAGAVVVAGIGWIVLMVPVYAD
jgi:hypothetical protein